MWLKSLIAGPGLSIGLSTGPNPNCSGSMSYDSQSNNVVITQVGNGGYQNSQVFANGSANVSLDTEAWETIQWARKKMEEEKRVLDWIEKNPHYKETYDHFKLVTILAGVHE